MPLVNLGVYGLLTPDISVTSVTDVGATRRSPSSRLHFTSVGNLGVYGLLPLLAVPALLLGVHWLCINGVGTALPLTFPLLGVHWLSINGVGTALPLTHFMSFKQVEPARSLCSLRIWRLKTSYALLPTWEQYGHWYLSTDLFPCIFSLCLLRACRVVSEATESNGNLRPSPESFLKIHKKCSGKD